MAADFDVAIVGCGPVGVTLANLLGARGLSVVVFERESSVYHHPRAGHFDGEVMRVFQGIGLAEAIKQHTIVSRGMRFVNAEGNLLIDWPRPPGLGPEGWHESYRFHQPELERMLRDGVARFERVAVKIGCEVIAIEVDTWQATLRYESLADKTSHVVSARYVVGCDGARSIVRRLMNTALEDLGSHERWLIVDLILKRPLPELPGVTVQYCDPARPATFVPMVGDRRRLELMVMPDDDPVAITHPERVRQLLSRWLEPDDAEIERAVVYTFHSVVACNWWAGRLLLAGDACHQTPPFLGQGMCAGIRDVANLAWKLAYVIKGRADPTLLASYQSERAGHVREYIAHAIRLGRIIQAIDPASAAERDAEMAASPQKISSIRPPLGPGLHGTLPPPAGTRSKQLRLADGRGLDDVVGDRIAVLCVDALSEPARAAIRRRDLSGDAEVVLDADNAVCGYLRELGADAVAIRPDRYILGMARGAAELDAVMAGIPLLRGGGG